MAKKTTTKAATQSVEETTTVETPVTEPVTEETTTDEPVEEKKENTPADSEEPVVTETEVPQDTVTSDTPTEPTDTPIDTDVPSTETPDTKTEEPAEDKKEDTPSTDPVTEPVTEEKPVVTLSSVYPVRYHVTFSQKRMAFVREMPIYNMLSTWCFNKSSFIGCTSKKDYEEIESCVKALPNDKVRIEGVMLSGAAKDQFLLKLKANTDYCVLKWGDKRK